MKELKTERFRHETEVIAYANEHVLTNPYATIVSITISERNPLSVSTYSLWWTERSALGEDS